MTTPAHHEHHLAHRLDAREARTRARHGASALGWRVVVDQPERLVFQVGLNWFSWGEIVTVTLRPSGVLIASRCRWFAQIVDWGKNRRNCTALAHAFARPSAR